ncbi:MAG TPA: transposase [Urbifossiella sp.]|nr:transposase [Urbifossiella sp.]
MTQRTRGRAAPGGRVVAAVPHGRHKNIGTVAALSTRGVVASAGSDGGTTSARSVEFVRGEWVPVPRRGQALAPDDPAAHNDPRVDEPAGAAGCGVTRLPPHSPDFNPIENATSKVKTALRKLATRTVPALFDGIAAAPESVTAADARAFTKHCGYATKRCKPL